MCLGRLGSVIRGIVTQCSSGELLRTTGGGLESLNFELPIGSHSKLASFFQAAAASARSCKPLHPIFYIPIISNIARPVARSRSRNSPPPHQTPSRHGKRRRVRAALATRNHSRVMRLRRAILWLKQGKNGEYHYALHTTTLGADSSLSFIIFR